MERPTFTALISMQHEAGYFLPDRHYSHIAGTYLFQLMVDKLLAIEQVDRIVINTDSSRIRDYYSRDRKVRVINGYQCPLHEPDLTSDKVTQSILDQVEGEHFLQLGAIFPFVKHSTLEYAVEAYYKYVINPEDWAHDSVFSIRGLYRKFYDNDNNTVRHDPPHVYLEDGILHVFNRTTFKASGNRKVGKNPHGVIVDDIENLAIDSDENYALAQLIDEKRYKFPSIFGR